MARGNPIPEDNAQETPRSMARQMRSKYNADRNPSGVEPEEFLNTGSTLLNLAMTDNPYCGYRKGRMVNLIGDSSSGKTFFAISAFAEATRDKRFADYRFIFDDVEAANSFDMEYLFGSKCAARIEEPSDKGASDTVEDFHDNVMRAIKAGKPFIYILDSADALTSEAEVDKAEENFKLREAGKEAKGGYGMSKAKGFSELLRQVIRNLEQTDSILIIISQTRDNIDPMSFSKKTRAGGRALKFYASHEIWMAIGKSHKKRDRVIGVDTEIRVSKNKITGKRRDVTTSIFYDYGIDDIGSCIDFMVEEEFWKKNKNTILAEDLDAEGTRDKLIRLVEDENRVDDLRDATGHAWAKIERELRLGRKPKYADDEED